jgi:pantoate kinase
MQAFAPGSLTAIFAPAPDDGGSLGVSLAIEDGVHATVTEAGSDPDGGIGTETGSPPDPPESDSSTEAGPYSGPDPTTITLDGERTAFEPVSNLLAELGVAARVSLSTSVPVGCGFGASGAATLASALAANATFDLGMSRDDLLVASHRAEVAAGTGLGDVFIQEVGGVAYNLGDGRERFESDATIGYSTFGGIDTAAVLGNEGSMERVDREGRAALAAFGTIDPLTLEAVFERAWPFTRAIDLATDRVAETVAAVEATGGLATMAMVGETVFGIGGREVFDARTHVANEGAGLRRPADRHR